MTSHTNVSSTTNSGRRDQLLQLQHELKTHLGIVTMGLHALEGVREDPDEFSKMSQTIEDEGMKPLKEIVAEIVAVALAEPN